ncbi:MAG: NADH-quinone oxidoreductase subunit K [Gemmatimonadota bacterium]
MTGLSALVVGALFASGVYLMLSGNVQRLALGFILLSNGVNLLVLAAAGIRPGGAPPLLDGEGPYVDPLPQAFVLTAIVIGLGTASYLLAMAARTHRETGSDDLEQGGGR